MRIVSVTEGIDYLVADYRVQPIEERLSVVILAPFFVYMNQNLLFNVIVIKIGPSLQLPFIAPTL